MLVMRIEKQIIYRHFKNKEKLDLQFKKAVHLHMSTFSKKNHHVPIIQHLHLYLFHVAAPPHTHTPVSSSTCSTNLNTREPTC